MFPTRQTSFALALIFFTAATTLAADPSKPKTAGTDAYGFHQAVRVGSGSLLHTTQLLPVVSNGDVEGGTVIEQTRHVMKKLDEALREHKSALANVVKLNVYVAVPTDAMDVIRTLQATYGAMPRPAMCLIVSRLPQPKALVGVDAVAVCGDGSGTTVRRTANGSILPPGPRIYISGQAEKGATLAEATRLTMASLQRTLQHVGADFKDVVQVKSFLTPMSNVEEARREILKLFPADAPPSCVFVEWKSSLPIEIEVVATVPADSPKLKNWSKEKPLAFITPPGMTASPVFCRAVLVDSPATIFVGGLISVVPGDGTSQVTEIFDQLNAVLAQTGSDLEHLAKATYYVSAADSSSKLNELRPRYYNPQRPPAASKAEITATGHVGRTLVLDMIAVPK